MFVLSRVRLAWSAGVGVVLAAVGAALVTTPQEPAAAEPAIVLPAGLQYVPMDAALFGHIDFQQLWKSALGDTFRKLKVPQLDAALKELTTHSGLTLGDVKTFTIWMPSFKVPDDIGAFGPVFRFGVVMTTAKSYDRKAMLTTLEAIKIGDRGKYSNEKNVVRLTTAADGPFPLGLYVDLSDDARIVAGVGLKKEPVAAGAMLPGATDPHAAAFKHALGGAAFVGGVNFANLPDEIRREDGFPMHMQPFLPIAKSERISLIGTLAGQALTLKTSIVSPKKEIAADVEKSLDILRKLSMEELTRNLAEVEKAEKGDDLLLLLPLLKASAAVLKSGKLEVNDRTTTATLDIPTDAPFGTLVELATGSRKINSIEDSNNLKQLGLAVHNYESAYATLPPTYLVDKKGKPTLSWRVMLLPFVEQNELYTKFKLDEPWNSEHNLKVYKDHPIPPVYLYPGDKADDKKTRYRVFTGNGAGWDVTGKLKLTDFTDGTSNTIAIATAATAVPWTKPEELEFDPEKEVKPLLHFRGERSNICLFDGSVRGVTKKVGEITLKGAVTRAGGEVLGADW